MEVERWKKGRRERGGGKGKGKKYEARDRQIQQVHTKFMAAPSTTC